jgi:hypothetical protein
MKDLIPIFILKINGMASKKELKKSVKEMVYYIMDECDYASITSADGNKSADKLMDEVAQYHDTIVSKLKAAKDKKSVTTLKEEIEKSAIDFMQKTNALSK